MWTAGSFGRGSDFERVLRRHEKADPPLPGGVAVLHDGGRHLDGLGARLLRHGRRHRDAAAGGVAAEDVTGEPAEAFAAGRQFIATHDGLGRDTRAILPDLQRPQVFHDGVMRLLRAGTNTDDGAAGKQHRRQDG